MDLSKIKSKLAEQQQKSSAGGKKDNKELFWRPSVGKQVIRIVPFKHYKELQFMPLKVLLWYWKQNYDFTP